MAHPQAFKHPWTYADGRRKTRPKRVGRERRGWPFGQWDEQFQGEVLLQGLERALAMQQRERAIMEWERDRLNRRCRFLESRPPLPPEDSEPRRPQPQVDALARRRKYLIELNQRLIVRRETRHRRDEGSHWNVGR